MYMGIGASGPNVQRLQKILNYYNDPQNALREDGVFGPKTKERVVDFQRRANLEPDGVVGNFTARALIGSTIFSFLGPPFRQI